MAVVIHNPTLIEAAGTKPKIIKEYVGLVNTGTKEVSIAKMESPSGWEEPGQTPEFNEYTYVLKGVLRVKTERETLHVHAGEAVMVAKGEWVQYSSPEREGVEYIAVCVPAFSPDTVHRDE